MKKFGTLALTLALAGTLAVPALAGEAPELVIAPAPNAYTAALTLNGEALDTAGIPAAGGSSLLPMRLIAEADHGSAYWNQEDNEGWFTFGEDRVIVHFEDNSVTLNSEPVAVSGVTVVSGVTFISTDLFDHLEGYQAELDAGRIDITTPNNAPIIKAAYRIMEESGMGFGMRADAQTLTEMYQFPADQFEQVVAFFPMITNPDTLVIGKLKDGADLETVKAALEAYRQQQEDTFSWYLSQHLPKVQDARLVVEGGYVLFLIAQDADAGVTAFRAFVGSV